MNASAFRGQFPVFERVSFMNAGTEGPVPRRAADAARERIEVELQNGRSGHDYMDSVMGLASRLREQYAALLGCASDEVALTGSTTDGVNTVLAALELGPGDEILTSDEEHPGLLAPLGRARRRHGATVTVVPFAELPAAVTESTRLVACSHISWVNGQVMDTAALAAAGVPFLLDGAQGLGAVPVNVAELGCHFYAASGQKWLCGPEGSGCLYVHPEYIDQLLVPWPNYGSLADPAQALDFGPAEGAARFDHGFPAGVRSAWALASLEVLGEAGWSWIHERAASLAASLAERLAAAGVASEPRGRSTLVSWGVEDPQAELERFAGAGIVVRSIIQFGLLRASVGAWSTEEELDRLVELVTG